ncbi:MAG: TolC family protein [Gemmatimonadota bacterium]
MNPRVSVAQVVAVMTTLVIAAAPAPAQSAGNEVPIITLQQARTRALAVNSRGVAARSQVETAAWERRTALTDLVTPNLSAGTSYTRFSDPFFNFGTGNISPSATSATLQASYTVLGRGKFSEIKRARASFESAAANETAAAFRIALAIDATYYGVLADRELLRVEADRWRRAQEQLDVARARVLSGAAIATDSLQLLLEVNRARLAVLRRDSALVVGRLALGNGIGLSGPADAAAIDTAALPPLPFTQESAIAELRSRGPELEAVRAAERRANAALGVEREAYLPEVTLGATMGAYDADFFPSALNRSQFVVNVSVPIWNGGQRELAIARARADRDVARAERAERERATAQVMAAAYSGYQTAGAAIELAQTGVGAASESYRVQRARYREGSTTILDLLEAQVALSEAEAALVQSRYAARLSLAQLEALLGRRVFTPEGS